ncbi:MAG TPA: YqgE/AlgH family protein [Gaiella sp.]|jgi:putative transcriptional regulator|nr:YqgE/AlgH family protein [Gaiella sp.]
MRSLRGQLLVAGPALLDPNFHRTVVLLGEHGEDGAMGLVLNRLSDVTVADAVPPVAELVADGELVHVGGPVQPQAVVVLADFVEPDRAGALVLDTIGFVPGDVDDASDLGELRSVRVYAGYAGWGPGQLEEELDEQSWVVLPARASDVFTSAPDALWSAVLRRHGGALGILSLLPEDPHVN